MLSQSLFLTATAATFIQAWRIVDAVHAILDKHLGDVKKEKKNIDPVGKSIFKMFEVNMDEYLDEEVEWIKSELDRICKAWDLKVSAKKMCHQASLKLIRVLLRCIC